MPASQRRSVFFRTSALSLAVLLLASALSFVAHPLSTARAAGEAVSVWLTTADQKNLLTPQSNGPTFTVGTPPSSVSQTISVNENTAYQQMDGFGSAMTDTSTWLIANKLSTATRNDLMTKLFDPTNGIGMSMIRQPMWGSDSNHQQTTGSYDDNGGQPDDTSLSHFSIAHDTGYVIPVLQQAKGLNPDLKILATNWVLGLPQWLVGNYTENICGSSKPTINPQYYPQYAQYFVKYIQAYQSNNLPIWAVTPMNEPDCAQYNTSFSASAENSFIKNNLGPALANTGVKILGYDHNWNDPSYPETLLNDATTSSYLSGTAWHIYGGSPSQMTTEQNKYPTKGQYMTEFSPNDNNWNNLGQYAEEVNITSERNWSKTMIMFVTAADTGLNEGYGSCYHGCPSLVSVDENAGTYTLDPWYYLLGHTSKFVHPGAYRIASNTFGDMTQFGSNASLDDVAYKNPNGSKALVAVNNTGSSNTFAVQWGNEYFTYTLPANSVATFTWSGTQGAQSTLQQLSGTPIGTGGSYSPNNATDYTKPTDGNINDYFDPATTPAWAGLDLGTGRTIAQIRFYPRSGYASRMQNGKFQGSNTADFSSGVQDLYTVPSTPADGQWTTVTINSTTAFRYVRYISASGQWCNIGQMQFYSAVTQLSGTAVGTGGSYSPNNATDYTKPTDGNLSDYFDPATTPAWAGLDLGTGRTIAQIRFYPRSGYASRMQNGKFQGSNSADFSSGVQDLYTIPSTPADGQWATVTITNSGTYRYVRYTSDPSQWCNIGQMQFYGF